jgi:hypothetical protein
MAAHRYWQIAIATNDGAGAVVMGLSQLAMRDSGGTDRYPGASAYSSSDTLQAGSLASLGSGSPSTSLAQWLPFTLRKDPWTINVDFGSGNAYDITEIEMYPNKDDATRTPDYFWLAYSDNGTDYTEKMLVTTSGWVIGTSKIFTVPALANAQYWALGPFLAAVSSGGNNSFAEVQLRGVTGGSDLTGSGTAFASDSTSGQTPDLAVDNDDTTLWSNGDIRPNYWAYDFGSGNDCYIAEVVMTSRDNSFCIQTPTRFVVSRSADAESWECVWVGADATTWGITETRTFTGPPSPNPSITSLSPTSGPTTGGTSVTIIGLLLTGTTDVQFDGNSATSIVVVDDSTITCDTPAGALGAVDVEIFNPAGNDTLTNGFTYYAATLVSILPVAGIVTGGTPVTITGTLLTGATDVQFDGDSATSIVVVDDNTITCDTPAHIAGIVDVQVFTPSNGNPTLPASFTYGGSQPLRTTQTPVLVLDHSEQPARVTQAPLLILYQEEQPNRITQTAVLTLYTPKPVPLPKAIIPEMPFLESWGWLTVISAAKNGDEWRSRLRETPRYKLQMSALILNEEDRVSVYNMIMRYLRTIFIYPMFQYSTELTAPALIGDTKIFANTAFTDLRDGETFAVFDPELNDIEYLTISTVDSDGVNLAAPLIFNIPTYWQLCPSFEFRTAANVGLNMNAIDGNFSIVMESVKPRVFQRPGAAPTLTRIDGILIVTQRPLANDPIPEAFTSGAVWFDNGTSVPDILNEWSNPRVGSKVSFIYDRRTDSDYWRAVCDEVKGRQNVALFPTFRDDLPLRADIALNADTFTTNNINFVNWWLELNYRYIMIDTANGMKYRRVINVDPHYDSNGDPDYITIKLADTIGNVAGDNVINRISYMNLFRLDDDNILLTHSELETQIDLPIMAENK